MKSLIASPASCSISSHHPRGIIFCGRSNFSSSSSPRFPFLKAAASFSELQRSQSKLESLFCYDKPIPEEIIESPVGLSIKKKEIGDKAPCLDCELKGAVLCSTCSGSGLYVDSILECQGIIVKVRCLGCGGSGNIMCSSCGGRGHL